MTQLTENKFYQHGTALHKKMVEEIDGDGEWAIAEMKLCMAKIDEYRKGLWVELPHTNEEGLPVLHGCRMLARRTMRYWTSRLDALCYDMQRNTVAYNLMEEWRMALYKEGQPYHELRC